MFEPIRDDYAPEPTRRRRAQKHSEPRKYALIALAATIAGAALAVGGVLVYGRVTPTRTDVPNAAPTSAVTITAQPTPATTPQPAQTTTVQRSTTTTRSASNAPAVFGKSCDDLGRRAQDANGILLTCDVSGDSGSRWVDENTVAIGILCEPEADGDIGYAADNKTRLICLYDKHSDSYSYTNQGPITAGYHQPGEKCDHTSQTGTVSTNDGKALTCQPASAASNDWIWTPLL
ncbi:hypothetical protein ACIP5Y_39855 [Nocardia sp. NPDC088792]|uniref:hypothetical protein n=1 Tax=Nocardia sp. NPDC088792 TaxID=3364332 RepID=UPI0038202581